MPSFSAPVAAIAIVLAGTAAATAALPPNYQRAREVRAVVDAVAAAIERHPVDRVSYEGDNRYEVIAGPCRVIATIVPEPTPGIAGPMKFSVALGKPDCAE